MGVDIALVADDLTGALDAAAPFAARGLRVRVYRSVDALPAAGASPGAADLPPPADVFPPADLLPPMEDAPEHAAASQPHGTVLAVNTSSRHVAPAAARAAVAAAGRRLREWSPRLVFKKIDSTLRGPVPDEVAAAMEVFERSAALVCPAFPAAGRVVRGGEIFVHGELLRETEYTRDLRTPAPGEPLAALFGRIGAVRTLRPAETPWHRPPAGITLADAETESRLASLAALVWEHAREVLAVGSDGLAAGLASLLGGENPPVRLAGGGGRIVLFALGSRAGTTADQTNRLLEARPDTPVVDAPGGVLDPGAVLGAARSARVVVARVPASPRGEPGAVARAFAAGVRTAVDRLGGPGRLTALVATGGDTVEAILDVFGIAELDVLGEFRPGIPVSGGVADGADLTLVSKAGGFGTPELFAEIAAETTSP